MPRFAILRHEMPAHRSRPSHWDLMLEEGEVLTTWAIPAIPAAGSAVVAEQLPDHRRDYLEYEGPVSGDRGSVTRWDAGDFEWISRDANQLRIRVQGRQLKGELTLTRDRPDSHRWMLRFSPA
jgi:hypothetical protein